MCQNSFEEETRKKVSLTLLKYQQQHDLTQQQLAERLGISASQLRRYINQNANMSMSALCRICEITGLSINNNE